MARGFKEGLAPTIGNAVMKDLKAAIGKNVAVESFDGRKTTMLNGKLTNVDAFNTITVEIGGGMFVVPQFINRGKAIRTITSVDGVLYDNTANVGPKLTSRKMTRDERLTLKIKSFGRKIAFEQEAKELGWHMDALELLAGLHRGC